MTRAMLAALATLPAKFWAACALLAAIIASLVILAGTQ